MDRNITSDDFLIEEISLEVIGGAAVEVAVVNWCVGAANVNDVVDTFDVGAFWAVVAWEFGIETNEKLPADEVDGAAFEEIGVEPDRRFDGSAK